MKRWLYLLATLYLGTACQATECIENTKIKVCVPLGNTCPEKIEGSYQGHGTYADRIFDNITLVNASCGDLECCCIYRAKQK